MEKSKPGVFSPILRGILPVLGLVLLVSSLGPSLITPWWEVRFALIVRGDYAIKDFEKAFAGEFAYRARWEGTMEQDGADFLLYHVGTDVQGWEIREKASLPDATRILTEQEVSERPRLLLNYILRQGRTLRFDFEVQGIRIPLGPSLEKFDLVLPCSKEPPEEGAVYNASISKGTNEISIGEDGLEKGTLEKSFSWEWKRQQWAVREKGPVRVAAFHKVSVVVTLIRHS
jgi:hypothetical protein